MSWSYQQVTVLVENYKKHPCLYMIRNKDYHNKRIRSSALREIVDNINTLRPGITEREVQRKFQGLRNTYAAERRKVLTSMRAGVTEDEVYQPSLWYYELMDFLDGQLQIKQSLSNQCSSSEDDPLHTEVDLDSSSLIQDDDESICLDDVCEVKESILPFSKQSEACSTGQKRPLQNSTESESSGRDSISNEFQQRSQPNGPMLRTSEDIMGEFVAAQLKKIKYEDVKLDTQFEIHRILKEALQNNK